jgi:hypothetical protein
MEDPNGNIQLYIAASWSSYRQGKFFTHFDDWQREFMVAVTNPSF